MRDFSWVSANVLIDRTLQRSTDALVGREFDPLLTPHLAYLAAQKKVHATKRLRVMLISSSVDEIPPLGIGIGPSCESSLRLS